MHRMVLTLLLSAVLAACSAPSTALPSGSAVVVEGCPITLAEAHAAVPALIRGPDIGQPSKNVTEDCMFFSADTDSQGHPAAVGILVFDARGAGVHMWDSARRDPSFPNATTVPGLGDDAFVTGAPRPTDLFAVQGQIALHIADLLPGGVTVEQFAQLARAAFARLQP